MVRTYRCGMWGRSWDRDGVWILNPMANREWPRFHLPHDWEIGNFFPFSKNLPFVRVTDETDL